jgi:plastocyanin
MPGVTVMKGLGFLIGVTFLVAGLAVAQEPQAARTAIAIEGFAFKPGEMNVSPGAEVTWTNKDGASHTVTASDKSFDSGALGNGKTFKQKFAKAGTFDYACAIHPSMKGKVVVK